MFSTNDNSRSQNHLQRTLQVPKNPFMYYSAFKLALYFDNNINKCVPVHSIETKATLPQIQYRKIQEITLNREHGYEWCLERAMQLKNKLHAAILYSAYEDICFARFTKGKWLHYLQPEFTNENRIVTSKQFLIKNGFVILEDVEANQLAIK